MKVQILPTQRLYRRALLAALFVCISVTGFSQAVKDLPPPTNYVSDYAHVLSPATTQQLDRLCAEVDHQAKAQIAVVTVQTTNGDAIGDYAVALEDAWKVGPKGSNRGVIVLLAVKDRQRFISTGYGLEGILPDSRVGVIGRQMVPYLQQGDYNSAVTLAVGQISQIIAADAHVSLQTMQRRGPPPQAVHLSLGQIIFLALGLFVLVIILMRTGAGGLIGFLLGMFFGGGGPWRGGGGGGGDGGGDGGGFGGFGGGQTGGGGAGGDW